MFFKFQFIGDLCADEEFVWDGFKNPLWDNVARDYVYSDSHVPVCELRIVKEISHENMQNLTVSDSDMELQKNSKVTPV